MQTLIQELTRFLSLHQELVDRFNALASTVEAQGRTIAEMDRRLLERTEPGPAPVTESTPKLDEEYFIDRALETIQKYGPKITIKVIAGHIERPEGSTGTLMSKMKRRGLIISGYGEHRLTERGQKRLAEIVQVPASAPTVAEHVTPPTNATLAAIASACDCRVKDQMGRDLLRHIATTDPVSYATMGRAIQRSAPVVADYLRRFGDIVKREPVSAQRHRYSVNAAALSGHAKDCSKNQPPPTASQQKAASVPERMQEMRDRRDFIHHLRTYGIRKGLSEQQHQDALNTIYALMAATGCDPRGKYENGKRLKPIDYLEKSGLAAEALRLARETFPLSEAAA